jgi:hypothetical protein
MGNNTYNRLKLFQNERVTRSSRGCVNGRENRSKYGVKQK